jgi:transcriptional regulator with XRE-family HTH domain
VIQTTLFRQLVQERGWTTVETFNIHFSKAARELAEQTGEQKLAGITVSRRSFDRWMRGELFRAPQRDTRRVLEHLFDVPAARLFRPTGGAAALVPSPPEPDGSPASPIDAGMTAFPQAGVPQACVDPGLIPHWSGLLRILSVSHNAFGPHRIHGTVTREMGVIRDHRLRADAPVRKGLLRVEACWAEFASWTAENLGSGEDAAFWLGHSLDLARQAGDAPMQAYVLMRQAQRAAERRDAQGARDLAAGARAIETASERDRALSAVRLAHGHALAGDSRLCSKALQAAHQLVEHAEDCGANDDPATIGHHCIPAYVQAHEAYCLLLLGRPAEATPRLREALVSWPTDFRQDAQLARAWLALAYAADGRLAEAAAEGTSVLASTATGGSARVLRALQTLDRRLATGTGSPTEVTQFRSALALTAPKM